MQRKAIIATIDLDKIVHAIFSTGYPIVYETYSAFDSDILSFSSSLDLNSYIFHALSEERHLGFSIHFPDTKGFLKKYKIKLNKDKCNGHTYRYRMNGWGLIQFQINKQMIQNISCHFSVNSEKRALLWYSTYPELQPPSLWDWRTIESHTRRLIRELKKHTL